MALPQAGVQLIAEGLSSYLSGLNSADKASKDFFGSLDDGGKRVSNFSQIATGALREVGAVAVTALGAAAQAIGGAVSSTISVAADYESTLNTFSAVTGESLANAGMSVDDFSDLFLEMGIKTQFSAQEAAQAAIELAKGGLDPLTISSGGLEAALGLAAAGELGLAQSSEILAKQLGVWASEGLKASEVADLLAAGANSSTVNVDDLAIGLANVGGVAKVAGLNFDETVTVLAQIAPGFSSASDAGTSFKAFLNNLQPTTKKATETMMALGLATEDGISLFYDAEGSFIGMEKASQLLYEATKDLSEADRSLALETIFGADAQRAAALIAENGAAGYQKQAAAMEAAGGAAAQAAARNKGLKFAMDALKGSVETLQIIIGMALMPVLTSLVENVITPAVNKFTELAQAVFAAGGPFESLQNYFSIIAEDGDYLNDHLSELPEAFKPIILAIGKTVAVFKAIAGVFTADSFSGMVESMTDLTKIVGPQAAGAIVKLIEAGKNLAATFVNIVGQAFTFFTNTIMPAFGNAVISILGFINEHWEAFKGALIGIGALLLGPLVMGAISAIGAALATLLSPVMLVVGAAALLGAAWSTNFLGIQDTVMGFVNYLIGAFQPVIAAFQQFGAGALQEIIAFVTGSQTQFTNLTAILSSIGAFVSQILSDLVGYVQAMLPIWIANLANWGMAAWSWIQPAISAAMAKIAEWGTSLLSYLAANLPTWIAQLLQWGTAAAEWIGKAIPPLLVKAGEFLGALLEWMLGTALPAIIETAVKWGEAIYNWVADVAIPKIGPALMNFLKAMLASMAEILKAMIKAAKEIGEGIIDGLVDAIRDGASSVVSAIINMVTQAIEAAKRALGIASPSKEFANLGAETMAGFAQGIKDNEKEPSVAAIKAARKTIDQVLGALKGVEGHGISDEITEVLESWSKTVGSLTDLFDNLEKLAGFKKFNSESFRKAVVEGTAGVLNGLREAANYISAQFKAYTGKQLDAMEVRGTVQELLDNWINSIGSIADMIENLKALFAFGKRKTIDTFLDSVRTGTGALIDALRAAAQIVVEKFGTANLGMPTISDEIQTMLDNWTGLISTITDALANIKKLWSFGKSNTQGLKESVYDAVIKIMEAMNAVQQAVTDSKPAQTASNLMQNALNQSLASSDIQVKVPQISMTMGQNTGVAIVDGMEGAIRKSGVRVADALVDVVTTAIDAAKKALGIASPSKVFFEVGMNTTKGLGLGIERGGYQVVDVMTETLGRMINAIPSIGRGGTIAPPMSGQQIAQNSVINNSTSRSFTYAPNYNTAPPQTVDMAIANAMAGSFA